MSWTASWLRSVRRCFLGVLLCLSVVLGATNASAQVPIVEAGREADVLALFSPYVLGGEVTPGWKLWNVGILSTEIRVELHGPGEPPEIVRLVLTHPSDGRLGGFETSENFNLSFPTAIQGPGKDAALALAAAVKRNDRRSFWASETNLPAPEAADRVLSSRALQLTRDPLLRFALFVALIVWMLGADLLRMRRAERAWLLAALALGVVLRLTLTQQMALDAWPFSRSPALATATFSSLIVRQASHDHIFFLTDFIFQIGLVCGLLGPAVVFLHARRMLGSTQAGIIAAFLLAIWPSHLRFSHADGTFIASIVFSGMAFALTHDALRHPHRNWRWGALGALAPVLLVTLSLRPLNQIFAVLLLGVALWLPGDAPRWRRGLVAAVIASLTLLLSVPEFMRQNSEQVRSGLGSSLFTQAVTGFFSYDLNTFIRLDMTPPLGVLLAGVGVWALWRQQRRVAIFVTAWFAAFFVTHSYILASSPQMQARYHLHLIVPVILLAAAGTAHLFKQRPRLAQASVGVLCLSPLLHLGFIQDQQLNQPAEHRFVHSLRPLIPEGCTVVEFVGAPGRDIRFARVGDQLRYGLRSQRYKVVKVESDSKDLDQVVARARSSGCARLYLGIECYVAGEPEAAACTQLRAAATSTVRELDQINRVYDSNNQFKNPHRERFRMGLYSLD